MGRKSNKRLKLSLLICGFMGLTVLPFAASYSSTTISNAASIRVTDTANALIAVQLATHEAYFPGNEVSGYVTNNMGVPLTSLSASKATFNLSSLSSGAANTLSFSAPSQSGFYAGEIHATWHNGSAQIPYSTYITVVDPADLDVTWDAASAQISVVNNSGHNLMATVGDKSANLSSTGSAQFHQSGSKSVHLVDNSLALFERTGNTTDVIFSLGGQRTYTITIPTVLLPPPKPTPAIPEAHPGEEPLEDRPLGEQETISNFDYNLPVSERTIIKGDDNVPVSRSEATEVIIEP